MITAEEYTRLRSKYDLYHAEMRRLFPKSNWVDDTRRKMLPPSCSNEEISAIEVYEFCTDIPDRYSAYVQHESVGKFTDYYRLSGMSCQMTTWTGEFLGYGYFGRPFRSNFGDIRIPITVHAINHKVYSGMFYYSAGDYCRVKILKEKG